MGKGKRKRKRIRGSRGIRSKDSGDWRVTRGQFRRRLRVGELKKLKLGGATQARFRQLEDLGLEREEPVTSEPESSEEDRAPSPSPVTVRSESPEAAEVPPSRTVRLASPTPLPRRRPSRGQKAAAGAPAQSSGITAESQAGATTRRKKVERSPSVSPLKLRGWSTK